MLGGIAIIGALVVGTIFTGGALSVVLAGAVIGGAIGAVAGAAIGGLATEVAAFGAMIGGGGLALAGGGILGGGAALATVSVGTAIGIGVGVGVLGAIGVVMMAKNSNGPIRYSDGTGKNPDGSNMSQYEAEQAYKKSKDPVFRAKLKRWMKGQKYRHSHLKGLIFLPLAGEWLRRMFANEW